MGDARCVVPRRDRPAQAPRLVPATAQGPRERRRRPERRGGPVPRTPDGPLAELEGQSGRQVYPPTHRFGGALDDEFTRGYTLERWKPHPLNVSYIRKACELADSKGIAVYWLMPPVSPPLQALCDSSGTAAALGRFAARMQEACPNLVVIDARHSGFPLDDFADPIHLNGVGNHALSTLLAEALAARIPLRQTAPDASNSPPPAPSPPQFPAKTSMARPSPSGRSPCAADRQGRADLRSFRVALVDSTSMPCPRPTQALVGKPREPYGQRGARCPPPEPSCERPGPSGRS